MVDFNPREGPVRQRVKITHETDWVSLRNLARYAALGIVAALLTTVYCLEGQAIIKRGYQIEQLKKEQASADELYLKLLLERAALRAPHRIDAYARKNLSLAPPLSHQIIFRQKRDAPMSQDTLLALDHASGGKN
ncbi:MAG: cell division protein FtsL [Acidobacteria bacterium]|nr:cell division protein FtsL [Acidobacteriota bacterium]MBI3657794.1 cell division protein FtsL [Acidobacteriota bacterium]